MVPPSVDAICSSVPARSLSTHAGAEALASSPAVPDVASASVATGLTSPLDDSSSMTSVVASEQASSSNVSASTPSLPCQSSLPTLTLDTEGQELERASPLVHSAAKRSEAGSELSDDLVHKKQRIG
jgi:hypothetical protein